MEAEIISVGSRLLRGQDANDNAAFLTRKLTPMGIMIRQCTMVGDNPEILKETIEQAEKRVNFIVMTGGLGPSKDDITKKVISEHLDVPLVLDRETEDRIITYHKNSDFTMPENNQLQALVLQGSSPLQNVTGLAAGMFFQKGQHTYLLLPGPSDELEPMFNQEARPLIIDNLLENSSICTRILRLYGRTESETVRDLEDLLQSEGNPFLGVYMDGEEVEVHITARAETEEEAEQKVKEVEKEVSKRLGDFIFGYGDNKMPDVVKDMLKENGMMVTAAESLTGGAFLSTFSSELEAGSIFGGGVVTYSSDIKNNVLGVTEKTIDNFGVVSSQCAIEMAEKSRKMFDADIGVSLTGVAGPSSLEGQIPGTVWIGIAKEGEKSFAKQYHFAYKRNRNRNHAVLSAMNLVRLLLLEKPITNKIFMDDEVHGEEAKEERQ